MLRDPPTMSVRQVKNGFFNVTEIYYDNILFQTNSYYCRKDSMANLFDDLGRELPVTMRKVKIYRTEKKKVRLIESDTLTSFWGILYVFSAWVPLFSVFNGWTTAKDFWWLMIPFMVSFAVFLIISNDKWEDKITHRYKKVKVEIDG